MRGESVLLPGMAPRNLLWQNIVEGSVVVRSQHEGGSVYEAAKDYEIDYRMGIIARTADSRIPDYSRNQLWGQKDFDHQAFPGFGNNGDFAWIDYASTDERPIAMPATTTLLPRLGERLRGGQRVKVVAFGDSITVGVDATRHDLTFVERYARFLRQKYPESKIEMINAATDGDTSLQGLRRIHEKVLREQPDLLLLGFGMNDHNKKPIGVDPELFAQNLQTMIKLTRESTPAEVLMYSTFPPNPDWRFGTGRMDLYAAITRAVAAEMQCAFGDVYSVWMKLLQRKEPSSLLSNNVNHPNDWTHWIYCEVLKSIEF